MSGYIDLKTLNLDELVGVVNLYPWFGAARKELCLRMGEGWSDVQYAEAAMYVVAREKVAQMKRSSVHQDWTDADVERLLKSYISEKPKAEPAVARDEARGERRYYAVGGDYFSQEAYDQVSRTEDNVFSRYAAKAKQERPAAAVRAEDPALGFYTETLAQIYAEQGYYEQAKEIYSKLILAYPEKNTYFAALIQKLDQINS